MTFLRNSSLENILCFVKYILIFNTSYLLYMNGAQFAIFMYANNSLFLPFSNNLPNIEKSIFQFLTGCFSF